MSFKLLNVSQTPVASAYTPNSILNLSDPPMPLFAVKDRKRYATSTDVAWINNDQYLATLNLATETLHIYAFNRQDHSLTLLQTLSNQDGLQMFWPEKFAFSKNGSYLAIANSKHGMCSINLYHIDPQTHLINPTPSIK